MPLPEPARAGDVCRWAFLYEDAQLLSAPSFDFARTGRAALETALRLAGVEAGLLAHWEKGQDLAVVASQGVDEVGVLDDPHLAPLFRLVAEEGAPCVREGLPTGLALPRLGGADVTVLPLRLRLQPVPDEGPEAAALPAGRERRRHPARALVKPLGVLCLVGPPGSAPAPERLEGLVRFADLVSEVLTSARLYHMATHDELTDLYRRAELEHHLSVALTLGRHTNVPVALLMLDVDDLGRVNQAHGRARGDRVISRVARLVRAQVRDQDACFRYGGEEFAVVLPGADQDGAQATAEKVRQAVAGYPGFGDELRMTVSVGVAVFPYHADGPAGLLRKADQALFLAKQEGGDRVVVWHRRIPRHALRSDKMIGIITGDQSKDYRNVMMLLDTVVVVNSLLERKQVLGTLLDMMVHLSACDRGFLFLERDGQLVAEVAQDIRGAHVEAHDYCHEVVERVRRQALPVAVLGEDEGDEEGGGELVQACRAHGLERAIGLPLLVKGKQIGCMYFDSRSSPVEFQESDLIFMQALARELGNAIENARLYQENLEQKDALEELTGRLAQKVQAQASELADLERNLSQLQLRYNYDRIVGKSEAMQKVFKLLDRITDTDVPVLVQGETGTGKELVARALHLNGPRRDGPFVSVNCSALSESLLESELFGHVRGAFTGADQDRPGLFEQAHRGTIFLDEVQDMSPGMQRELLRVLQEGEVRRVGGKDIVHVDVRVISAANRDLRHMVQTGEFRQDLFYRLNVVTIDLPPLRDRKEDIPFIVRRLLEELRTTAGRPVQVDQEAMRQLISYDWPGNVRQLQNFLEKTALMIEGDTIRAEHVRLEGGAGGGPGISGTISKLFEDPYEEAKQAFLREYLKAVLARNGGNVTRAAHEAGIVRSSFHKMLKKHAIQARDFSG